MKAWALALTLVIPLSSAEALAADRSQPSWISVLWTRAKACYYAKVGDLAKSRELTAKSRELTAQIASWQIDAVIERLPGPTGWQWPLKIVPDPIERGSVTRSEALRFAGQLRRASVFLLQLDEQQAAALPEALQSSVRELAAKTTELKVDSSSLPRRNGKRDLRPTEAANAFLSAARGLAEAAHRLSWIE